MIVRASETGWRERIGKPLALGKRRAPRTRNKQIAGRSHTSREGREQESGGLCACKGTTTWLGNYILLVHPPPFLRCKAQPESIKALWEGASTIVWGCAAAIQDAYAANQAGGGESERTKGF